MLHGFERTSQRRAHAHDTDQEEHSATAASHSDLLNRMFLCKWITIYEYTGLFLCALAVEARKV